MLKKYTKIVEAKMKSFVNKKVVTVVELLRGGADIDTDFFAALQS